MSATYSVEIKYQNKTQTIEVSEDQTILEAALDAGIELPSSCNAGVCTTCAALLSEGEVSQADGMGLSPDLQKEGYALLCVAYPRSNLKLESEKEDMVYQRQFGQPSK
jgi:ferredoxin